VKKIFSRILGIFYTFILLFCFAGCTIIPGWDIDSGSGGSVPSDDNTTDNSGGSDDDEETDVDDPEFDQDEEGNYTYYSDYIETYDGVRILSVPTAGAESGNSVTDAERVRFYTNVSAQFEVLSEYILDYLVGEFGGGITATSITSWDGDYITAIESITPTNRNQDVYDSNAYVIERVIESWTYDGTTLTPIYDSAVEWNLSLGDGYISGDYASTYVSEYRRYVQLRLMEMVLNDLYDAGLTATTWSYASNPEDAQIRIDEYVQMFTKLGFIFENISSEIEDFILNDIIGSSAINYDNSNKEFSEPYYTYGETLINDVDGDGVYDIDDGDTYNDTNVNGEFDVNLKIYFDINGNGVGDDSFTSSSYSALGGVDGFYVGYATKISDLVANISYIVNGESYTDSNSNGSWDSEETYQDQNGNGVFDEGYISIYAMEVQDLTSEEFFTPGEMVETEDDTTIRKLTNMEYAEYKSVMFLASDITNFDCLTIYVDSETNFSMKIWLRVHTGGVTFTVPICILNLNSEKSCDWENEDETKVWTGEKDSWTDPEELFDDRERNSVWAMDLSVLLSEEYLALISETGVGAYEGTLDYLDRGYHTNSVDNTELKDMYDLFNVVGDEDNFYSLLSSSEDTYFEFVFEILDEEPDEDYNFKFLFMPTFWDIANVDEDEDVDI